MLIPRAVGQMGISLQQLPSLQCMGASPLMMGLHSIVQVSRLFSRGQY